MTGGRPSRRDGWGGGWEGENERRDRVGGVEAEGVESEGENEKLLSLRGRCNFFVSIRFVLFRFLTPNRTFRVTQNSTKFVSSLFLETRS
jgi:hypothetical protein